MKFKPLNLDTWERAPLFQHFIRDLRCVMSMTAEVDITDFLRAVHSRGQKFYPAMIWAVSSAINRREELRMGYDRQGDVGIWDFVSPYYAHFHPSDGRFAKLFTEYNPDYLEFYQRFEADAVRYRNLRWFELQDVPPNVFDLSCLPWISYKAFDMHIFDSGTYLAPVVTWGKYAENEKGRTILPLSINIHHAAADGYHLCRFFADVEEHLGLISSK